MKRSEFKKRMQSLKSYREQNPDKGYWDWKVEQFQDGGELSDDEKIIINRAWAKKVLRDAQAAIEMERGTRQIEPMPQRSFSEQLEDSERRREQARRESGIEGLKNIVRGFNRTAGTAASLASLIAGGGWALTRLLSGNRATSLGRVLAPGVIPANTADTAADAVDFVVDPSLSGAAEVGTGIVLGKWKNFGSKARQATELAGQSLNVNNAIESYFEGGETNEGGEVPPSDYRGSNEPVNVNPFTKKPLANGSVTPILDLEDASGFTPIGDILSIRDAYVAAKNKDLLGLGLAGLGVVPFIPTVNRKATQDLIDRAIKQSEKSKQVVDDFYTQRNNVYESMIENEDAFRRAARADKQAGTNYVGTYGQAIRDYLRDPSQYNDDLPMMLFDRDLYGTNIKMQVDPSRPGYITVNPRYKDPDELDDAFKRINPGLVRHEMGHQTDLKAGLQYTDRLADPSKFVSDEKLKEMFPKTHSRLKSTVLNKGSEIKSYMNEFREFLMGERKWEPKESVKSFRRKLDEYSKQFPTLRMIFDSYKSKSDFVRDYNAVPLTDTGTNQNLV